MNGSIGSICGVHANGGCFGNEGNDFQLFWQEGTKKDTAFRASVLFGRNGSGKTTLAAKIAEACDPANAACGFFDKDGNPIPLSTAEADRVRVFGESHVRDKVLIEEEGLAAIVMLGTQATAKKRIDEIDEELIELGEASTQFETVKEKAETGPDSLAKLAVTQAKRDKLKAERGQKEAEMNNASIAADVINGYLANVYFDKERFRLVAEGNRYKVMSYGKPVMPMDISTGERIPLRDFGQGGRSRILRHRQYSGGFSRDIPPSTTA